MDKKTKDKYKIGTIVGYFNNNKLLATFKIIRFNKSGIGHLDSWRTAKCLFAGTKRIGQDHWTVQGEYTFWLDSDEDCDATDAFPNLEVRKIEEDEFKRKYLPKIMAEAL